METKQRASHDEIMQNLSSLLGAEAVSVARQSAEMILAGDKKGGVQVLTDFDAILGGIGIYTIGSNRPLGVYRALFYVWLPLHRGHADDETRRIIYSACVYLEELLKKMVYQWPWEKIKAGGLPLGALVKRIEKRIPGGLSSSLSWLSSKVYNPAKHHFNFEQDEEPDKVHYFDLDEALAVYLIVRKLGLDLEKHFGRPREELLAEYPQ